MKKLGESRRSNYPLAPVPPLDIRGRYYGTDDAALILGVSQQRVLVFLGDGRLTGFKWGNSWFIAACSVERLMEIRDRVGAGTSAEEVTG